MRVLLTVLVVTTACGRAYKAPTNAPYVNFDDDAPGPQVETVSLSRSKKSKERKRRRDQQTFAMANFDELWIVEKLPQQESTVSQDLDGDGVAVTPGELTKDANNEETSPEPNVITQQPSPVPAQDRAQEKMSEKSLENRYSAVPLQLKILGTTVHAEITCGIADVSIIQSLKNPHSRKVTATHDFLLPMNSSVTDFTVKIGTRKIRGIIRERDMADNVYQAARNAGYKASVIKQKDFGLFSHEITNLPPKARLDVTISYFSALKSVNGKWRYLYRSTQHSTAPLDMRVKVNGLAAAIDSSHSISSDPSKNTARFSHQSFSGDFFVDLQQLEQIEFSKNGYFIAFGNAPEGATEVLTLEGRTLGRYYGARRGSSSNLHQKVWAHRKMRLLTDANQIRQLALENGLVSEHTALILVDSVKK